MMRGAVFTAIRQPLVIADLQLDALLPHEVRVRVAASSLCHSDMHMMSGQLPQPVPSVLGHEVAGIVIEVGGQVQSVAVGDHVVCCASVFCGQCSPCLGGHANRCEARPARSPGNSAIRFASDGAAMNQHVAIGGFAEEMLLHENAVVRVPRALPFEKGALLGCGVMSGVGAVINAAKVNPGSSVAIVGAGGVGLNVIQAARIAGAAQIVAIDMNEEKLALAQRLGATDVFLSGTDIVETVRQATGGGVDFAFEVVGLKQTIEDAIRMMRPGGTMTVVGLTGKDISFSVPGVLMMLNEWKVQGSRLGSGPFKRDIPILASLYLRGLLDLDSLIGEYIELDDINAGFDRMECGAIGRSVILFPETYHMASVPLPAEAGVPNAK